jgi:MoaA/NifB/PqqE/SkfB family radical SAM enzyme
MELDPVAISKLTVLRRREDRHAFCHAPSRNMNFEQSGLVSMCCHSRREALGKYPDESLISIWKGTRARALRDAMKEFKLPEGCDYCSAQLRTGTLEGLHARYYDHFETREWPTKMEFHLSNLCNLECTMCYGHLSSSIRERRDKLPPLGNPYDFEFVRQLEEFIPHLSSTVFLGGEPFLNPLHFEIWERFVALNPQVMVHVFTNGTVLGRKIVRFLDRLPFGITLSIDSLNRERYESIRLNADFERVMRNLKFFLGYARLIQQPLHIAACPMQQNWMDLPGLLRFCNENGILLGFNPTLDPPQASLRYLPPDELREIAGFLKAQIPASDTPVAEQNARAYRGVIRTLEHWSGRSQSATQSQLM